MLTRFLESCRSLPARPGDRAIVAVSGGPDSVALLDLLVRTGEQHGCELVTAHIDHGINPGSAAVAGQVEALSDSLGVRCTTVHLDLGADTTETVAREERYRALESVRERESARWILTAHHAGDQAETVLIRLLQGSGPAGLAGMAAVRGVVLRPLLPFSRDEILAYLEQRDLRWWDDPANLDPRHLRSWARHTVMPLLRERLPEVEEALAEVAEQAALDRRAWDALIDELPGLAWRVEPGGASVAVAPFAAYDSTVGAAVLRALFRRIGAGINRAQAGRAAQFLASGGSGRQFEAGAGWTIELEFGRARLSRSTRCEPGPAGIPLRIEGAGGSAQCGRWKFAWRPEAAPEVQERQGLTAWFTPVPLQVRFFEPGDRVHPLGGTGRRLVVRCLQDARVARRDRQGYPVLVDDEGEVAWVPGVSRSNRLVPPAGAEAMRVDAEIV